MNFDRNNQPPLEPQEAPWNDVEIHVRETLLQAEAVPPAGLEAGVFASLDEAAQGTETEGGSAWKPWALGAGLVGAAALTLITWDQARPEAAVPAVQPKQPQPALVEQPAQQSAAAEVRIDMSAEDSPAPATEETAKEQENPLDAVAQPMERMEVLGERGVQGLEGTQISPELKLQQGESAPILERRPATLEVKQ
jgi:hypothetical protein